MPDTIACPDCNGDGWVVEEVEECCGNVLPSGECCAAIYGTANLVLAQRQEQCGRCGGSGEVETA